MKKPLNFDKRLKKKTEICNKKKRKVKNFFICLMEVYLKRWSYFCLIVIISLIVSSAISKAILIKKEIIIGFIKLSL